MVAYQHVVRKQHQRPQIDNHTHLSALKPQNADNYQLCAYDNLEVISPRLNQKQDFWQFNGALARKWALATKTDEI